MLRELIPRLKSRLRYHRLPDNQVAAEVVVTNGSLWCRDHDLNRGINFWSTMQMLKQLYKKVISLLPPCVLLLFYDKDMQLKILPLPKTTDDLIHIHLHMLGRLIP